MFPRLARNTAHSRALREKYKSGEIEKEEYEIEESMEKNRISNISTVRSYFSIGSLGRFLSWIERLTAMWDLS